MPKWIAGLVASFELSAQRSARGADRGLLILLACFLDGVSIIVLAGSLLLPSVQPAGIDLIWFGVYMVLMVEMSIGHPASRTEPLRACR